MTDLDVRRIEDKVDNVALVLAELRGSLSPSLDKLTAQQEEATKRHEAHEIEVAKRFEKVEDRTDKLERFRYSIPSLAVLALLVDGALGLYLVFHQ